jgi:hypothetical protein
MSPPPKNVKIYHITHVENLANIIEAGALYSDAECIKKGVACNLVGMTAIKQRRLEHILVDCHAGTTVGEYVPFYFCPRSVMLYLLYRGNHPDVHYQGGQDPIVHLQADLRRTIDWAEEKGIRWAFSNSNAGAFYSQFFNRLRDLDKLDWNAIRSHDFRDPVTKEGKQAEFLLYGQFPWDLVEKIGVFNANTLDVAKDVVQNDLEITVEPTWYY